MTEVVQRRRAAAAASAAARYHRSLSRALPGERFNAESGNQADLMKAIQSLGGLTRSSLGRQGGQLPDAGIDVTNILCVCVCFSPEASAMAVGGLYAHTDRLMRTHTPMHTHTNTTTHKHTDQA